MTLYVIKVHEEIRRREEVLQGVQRIKDFALLHAGNGHRNAEFK